MAMALLVLFALPQETDAFAAGLPSLFSSHSSSNSSSLDAFLGEARKSGATVIVVQPHSEAKPPATNMSMGETLTSENLLRARYKFGDLIRNTGLFLKGLPVILKSAGENGSLQWVVRAVITAVGGLMLGTLLFRATARWGRDHFRYRFNPDETRRSMKLGYLLGRAGWILIATGIMFITAILVEVIFDYGLVPSRKTILVIISTYVGYKILRSVIFFNFFAPDVPNHRLINLSDEAAIRFYRHTTFVLAVTAFFIGIVRWIQELDLNLDAERLGFVVGALISAILFGGLAIVHRRELYDILLGQGDPDRKPGWRRIIAAAGLPLIIVYLAFAWFMSSVRLTLGLPGGYILVGAPIIVFIGALLVYAIAVFVLEIAYEARAESFRRSQILKALAEHRAWRRAVAAQKIAEGLSEEERDVLESGEEMTVHRVLEKPKPRPRELKPVFKGFFENAILATVLILSVAALARIWGIASESDSGQILSSALDILLVVFLAASGYKAVNNYIDEKILEEGGNQDEQESSTAEEGGMGKGQSRLATLLPVFRNVIIFAIIIFAFTLVLSNIGVNVAPLFAGAGVVGIAIGFGAQTLIRDIFSGAFFLIDDAFRKGEYIELDKVKGVVEKISMRSFQLRHHRGALHTVPFGEIHHLTNYSRDWVIMKLPLRLTYDTDVDKVRRLIKKIGQQLLDDPVLGPLFLQPLKSQGVYSMEDSAMIVRVKYMTRPGDQFVTRKAIYSLIQETFQQEDIHFAHREVTVRLADGEKAENLSPAEREAIAGSVRSVLDEETRTQSPNPSQSAANAL
jgi:small-conductance mechanosensitive channel